MDASSELVRKKFKRNYPFVEFAGTEIIMDKFLLSPFCAVDLFLYPLKTLENQMFSGGYRKKPVV